MKIDGLNVFLSSAFFALAGGNVCASILLHDEPYFPLLVMSSACFAVSGAMTIANGKNR